MKKIMKFFAYLISVFLMLILVIVFFPTEEKKFKNIDGYKIISANMTKNIEYKGKKSILLDYDWKGFKEYQSMIRMLSGIGEVQQSLAIIDDIEFKNGTIEVDILGNIAENNLPGARGFVGVAFRVGENADEYEAVYLRPSNGQSEDEVRKSHAIQYMAHPDFHFNISRKDFPGEYEKSANIDLDKWFNLRIEVKGKEAKFYIDDVLSLTVDDLKLGEDKSGKIAFWLNPGTKAYFSNLKIINLDK